jgi:recombination protein RecT
MANQADVTKAIAEKAADPAESMVALINKSAKELGRALPAHLNPERITRIAVTEIRKNPKLALCTQESFLGALFTSAQTGLELVAGRAYIIPFQNSRKKADGSWHKVYEAQFVIGYKGLADLFYRHEKAVQLDWGVVRIDDEFDYEYGSSAFLKHKPKLGNVAAPIAYWVQAVLANGGKTFRVMGAEECMAHGREHSKTWVSKEWSEEKRRMVDCEPHFAKDSPWFKEPESMCLKTVLIQLAKLLPLSVELQRAINVDESSRDFRDALRVGLDAPSTTAWTAPPDDKPELPAGVVDPEPVSEPAISQVTGKPIEM